MLKMERMYQHLNTVLMSGTQNDKPMKVPNKLQCHICGEIVSVYHPSSTRE
jgi:hypothetical protein